MGRWRHLKLRADYDGKIRCDQFISHVRATIAYLDANREAIQSVRFWSGPFKARAPELIDVEFTEITDARDKRT